MVKPGIPKGIPKGGDFIHQYGGGSHQHGIKGASPMSDQNAQDFQNHMQAQETQTSKVPKISPHDLMSRGQSQNFGAPNVEHLQAPAPENFGPPKIGHVDTDNMSKFGPPGSQSFKSPKSNFGAPKGQASSTANTSNHTSQNQLDPQLHSSQAASEQATHPKKLGAANKANSSKQSSGGKSGGGSGDSKKKATYKTVEKMEVNNMLQNAMSHMKLKDPDPKAWN